MTACPKCGHDPDATVTARWTLVLDKRLTSANLRTVNAGASRWRYAKERDAWQSWVKLERVNQRVTTARPSGKRRVTIERQYTGRCQEMDRDNLVAGCKPLVDALVREGVVHDDGPMWLELHVTQARADRNATVVVVEALAAIGAVEHRIRAGAPEAIGLTPSELRALTSEQVAAEDALRDPAVTAHNAEVLRTRRRP